MCFASPHGIPNGSDPASDADATTYPPANPHSAAIESDSFVAVAEDFSEAANGVARAYGVADGTHAPADPNAPAHASPDAGAALTELVCDGAGWCERS